MAFRNRSGSVHEGYREITLYAAIAIYKRVSTITNSHGCVCSWDGLSCTAA